MKNGLQGKSIYFILLNAKELQKYCKISLCKWFGPRSHIYKNLQL